MARKATRKPAGSKTPPSELQMLSDKRLSEMALLGEEMALLDAMQNLRVRAQRHLIPSKASRTR